VGVLFTALFVSLVGLGLFIYGKNERRAPQLGAGLVLMIYPQVAETPLVMLSVAGGVVVVMWLGIRMGL